MAMLATLLVASCHDSSSSVDGDVQYLAVQTESDGKWGMVDSEGKLLFADEFKNEPSAVVNGYFSVREGEHYTLYSASAKPEVVPGCDDLKSVGVFKDGIIPLAHENSRITFVDGKGNVKATLNSVGGKEIVACAIYPSEGLWGFKTEEDKWGFVDKKGNVVVDPKYDDVSLFSEGVALVRTEKNDEAVILAIDNKGQEVFRMKKDLYLETNMFSDGLLVARNSDDQWGFVNKKGEFTKVKGSVKRIGDYNSSLFAFMNEEYNWGVMDMNGETLIRPKYGSVYLLPDGNFFVKDDEKYYMLDKKGDKIQTLEDYSYINVLNKGKFSFIAKDKSTYVLLDKNGAPVGKEEFKGINYSPTVIGDLVKSDYFNFDSVLQVLVGGLTANGMDKYTLGMPVSQLGIEDYSSYVYNNTYRNPELNKDGWRYDVDFGVVTDESIATREYSDSYYSSDSKVVMNSDAKVNVIYVRVDTEVPCWKELKEKIISDIQAKGYKLKDQSDNDIHFSGKDCTLNLYANSSGDRITLNLYKDSSSDSGYYESDEVAVERDEFCDTVIAAEGVYAPAPY